MDADPNEAILVAQEIDVVIARPDSVELRRRFLAMAPRRELGPIDRK